MYLIVDKIVNSGDNFSVNFTFVRDPFLKKGLFYCFCDALRWDFTCLKAQGL